MSPQPGNVNKLTHAEALSTHVQPATSEASEVESSEIKPLIEALEASRLENERLRAELAATTEGRDAALQSLADANARIPETKLPEGETGGLQSETKQYSDGSSATGPAPLPDQSPAQQDAQNAACGPQLVPTEPQNTGGEQGTTDPQQPQNS